VLAGGLLEPRVGVLSTEFNPRTATLKPTQDGRQSGPHRGSGHSGGNTAVRLHAVDEGVGDDVLLLHKQEEGIRN
jgi:hypothetical protein